MIYRNFLIALIAVLTVSGCKKQEIPVFSEGRYVQFTKSVADTTAVSFFFYPNREEISYPLELALVGPMADRDISFQIEAVKEGTTATAAHYELPQNFTFRQGLTTDTAFLTIKKTPEMAEKAFRLVLRITPTGDVLPGETQFTTRVLELSDLVTRPAWWDATMERSYLGAYTERKFRTLMDVTGESDLSIYEPNRQRDIMLQFKYYLIQMRDAGTPVLEEDGTDMLSTVPLIG